MKVWDEVMTHLGVRPLNHGAEDDLLTVEYATGLLAREDCADVVEVLLPEDASLRSKPGCGINGPSLGDRIRSWFD
jgi:hypothetical protein